MEKDLIYLILPKFIQDRVIKFLCGSQKIDTTKIVGIGEVKKNIGVLEEGSKIIVIKDEEKLSKINPGISLEEKRKEEKKLFESLNLLNYYERFKFKTHSLQLNLTDCFSYNVIKEFKINDINFIPFEKAKEQYEKDLRERTLKTRKKGLIRKKI